MGGVDAEKEEGGGVQEEEGQEEKKQKEEQGQHSKGRTRMTRGTRNKKTQSVLLMN